jgi:hypothetical protein
VPKELAAVEVAGWLTAGEEQASLVAQEASIVRSGRPAVLAE